LCGTIRSKTAVQQAAALTLGQIVALRFAGDEELEQLVRQASAGNLASTKDIKQAIQTWRADYFRV
jgi:hypothetical protein